MTRSNNDAAQQGLPLGTAALLAGVGSLAMVVSAPFERLVKGRRL